MKTPRMHMAARAAAAQWGPEVRRPARSRIWCPIAMLWRRPRRNRVMRVKSAALRERLTTFLTAPGHRPLMALDPGRRQRRVRIAADALTFRTRVQVPAVAGWPAALLGPKPPRHLSMGSPGSLRLRIGAPAVRVPASAPRVLSAAPAQRIDRAALVRSMARVWPQVFGRREFGSTWTPRSCLPARAAAVQLAPRSSDHAPALDRTVRRAAPPIAASHPPPPVHTGPHLLWRQRHTAPSSSPPDRRTDSEPAAPQVRTGAHGPAGPAPTVIAGAGHDIGAVRAASPAPALDAAFVDRLADDVLRRVERRVRIERERRGQ